MFTPRALALERGWPGKIEDDRVIQVAAQTVEAFFTGGGTTRDHAIYPLDDVFLRAPVLRPPSIRFFENDRCARAYSAQNTRLRPGDLLVAPPFEVRSGVTGHALEGLGTLRNTLA
jgi:hypothetical protein